jgi:hypothetical protein
MIVTTRHLFTIPGYSTRRGFCRDKSKAWARRNQIDWKDFVRNGIDSDRLEATGDGFALALVAWARECKAKERAHG